MAITVDSVSPAVVDSEGGRLLTVTGTGFELLETYNVHVGAAGDATDPACYAGQGKGINITPKSTTTLECFLPPLPAGTILSVFGVQSDDSGVNDLLTDPLTVVEPQQSSSIFSMRRLFAPNRLVGKRTFDLFPAVDSAKNLLRESGDFADAVWTKQESSIVATEEDPFGGLLGFILHEDGVGGGVHSVEQLASLPTPALVAGRLYTTSIYAKAINRDWMALRISDGSDIFTHTFNVTTGVLGQFVVGTGFARIRPGSFAGTTGWFRVEMTIRPNNSNPYSFAYAAASSATVVPFAGLDQDSTRLAFPNVDEYPLARAYRATGATAIL